MRDAPKRGQKHLKAGYRIVFNPAAISYQYYDVAPAAYLKRARETGRSDQELLAKHPERIIEKAVYGMLPKTALGRQVLRRKLRVYANADHPHVAQQPKTLTFNKDEK